LVGGGGRRSINTDNSLVFATSLAQEYHHPGHALGLSNAGLGAAAPKLGLAPGRSR
jgi:adenosine deaminase